MGAARTLRWKYLFGATAIALLLLTLGIIILPDNDEAKELPVPQPEEWTDYGTILTAGEQGEWDRYLYGAFAATAIKKDGVYLLYYQGAGGLRDADETVTGRAIGVATSLDGINFTKYAGNPIVTWSPTGNGEEGAVSSGAALEDGKVVLYYGANSEESALKINADARLATSEDGFHFVDEGVVLDHSDGDVWGSGDELFPIIAFTEAGRWYVYYLPNGVLVQRRLGVAWGDAPDQLVHSAIARNELRSISA